MSILLVNATSPLGEAIAKRLLAQGDEVRAIVEDDETSAGLRELGVHIARGEWWDADLVERAAQNVRTIVYIEPQTGPLDGVLDGARAAGVERLVVCGVIPREVRELLRTLPYDHVMLETGRKRGFLRSVLPVDVVAEAVDAADDIAGNPRLELDLTKPEAWSELKLEAP
jgi:NAD(P)-dependent dehydrogenase (short-subunit alcohol dehydrogenase family)